MRVRDEREWNMYESRGFKTTESLTHYLKYKLHTRSGVSSSCVGPTRAVSHDRQILERTPTVHSMVQSLNSPFFAPHIGVEPGRAKLESRITCMRMLRTNQSKSLKITRSQQYYAARVDVSRNAFFSLRSSRALKKYLFDVDIVLENKSKCGLSWSALLSTTSTRHNSFPKHFLYCFCMLSEFVKVFERKSDAYK